MTVSRRSSTWPEIVAEHLKARGHISEGSALIEYGRFRLGDAIFRLRTTHAHLLPPGKEIVTMHKQDTQGNRYGEYHLVRTQAAETRRLIEEARARANETARVQRGYPPSVRDRAA